MEQSWMNELYQRLRQEQLERKAREQHEARAQMAAGWTEPAGPSGRVVNRFGDRVQVIVKEQPVSEAVNAYLELIKHAPKAER